MKKILFILIPIIFLTVFLLLNNAKKNDDARIMTDLTGYTSEEVKQFAAQNNLNLKINEIYSDDYDIDTVVKQSIDVGKNYTPNTDLVIDIVVGSLEDKKTVDIKLYSENAVNELGRVPVMMYHGIHNLKDADTNYIGGNVDKDGYQRTAESFRNDLEFYYQHNYRMIRLTDYVDGIIDVELGKSPIVLTFDDGLQNNINVTGLDENGDIIIDPNCAIGILEEFKKKYPDYHVTATFFITSALFNQPKYNEKILKWLVDNGYDIGNHSVNHPDFTKIDVTETNYQIGKVYEQLETILENSYVNIVALPYGSPYKTSHENFSHILSATYNGKNYVTKSTLRVGWESDYSPFSNDFDKQFIKRIRAYDNNGIEFDIKMNFDNLENNRYISDGDKNQIVIKEEMLGKLNNPNNLKVVTY